MSKVIDRSKDIGEFKPQPDDDMLICRCEEITKGEIRKAVHDGMWTLTEIRRYLRTGMGLCQGKTCGQLVLREIANATGQNVADLKFHNIRPPVVGVKLHLIAEEAKKHEE